MLNNVKNILYYRNIKKLSNLLLNKFYLKIIIKKLMKLVT